jgi:hypothetical protein
MVGNWSATHENFSNFITTLSACTTMHNYDKKRNLVKWMWQYVRVLINGDDDYRQAIKPTDR